MRVHRLTETTQLDLVLTQHPPSITVSSDTEVMTEGTVPEDRVKLVQLKRTTLRSLLYALQTARTKLKTAQQRQKADFDKKVRFRPVIQAGDEVYIDRPPRLLTAAEKRKRGEQASEDELV